MSWCEVQRAGNLRIGRLARAGLAVAILAATAPLLGGCGDSGFRPMYASTSGGTRVDQKLAALEITTIPGKTGQRLRNELIFQATGGGEPLPPAYRLDIVLTEAVAATLVTSTGKSTSTIYNLEAKFKLIDIKSKKVLLEGVSYGRAMYDRFPSIYSNVRASDDASARAARTIADDLKVRLAAFLSNDKY